LFGLSVSGVLLYVLYPISVIYISMYVSGTKDMTLDSYFFANRNTHWLVVGFSIFTTCICSPYIFGLTSAGLASGLPIIYGVTSAIMLVILGWFLAPLFLKTKINTLPEYFERRFNRSCRLFLSTIYVLVNVCLRLFIILIAGSAIISVITGMDSYSSILFFLVITGIYVTIGGLQAEIYVNTIQILLITIGLVAFSSWVVSQEPGTQSMIARSSSISYFNSSINSDFTWTGLLIGLPIIGFWFWCADQFVIQKVLSVKTVNCAKKASLVSVFLQIIPILIFILPGILVITLSQSISSESALRNLFVDGALPESVRVGFIIAVASALMASFASLFNSTSVLITFDFYHNFKPSASDRKLVLVGRLTTMVLVLLSILLIPVSQKMNFDFCIKLFTFFTFFAALVGAVFIMGLVYNKANALSAFFTLSAGTLIIILRAVLELFFNSSSDGNIVVNFFVKSDFLVFSTFIFLLSLLLLFIFSRLQWKQQSIKSSEEILLK
jgi:solute:Na+ symporter, SSS family